MHGACAYTSLFTPIFATKSSHFNLWIELGGKRKVASIECWIPNDDMMRMAPIVLPYTISLWMRNALYANTTQNEIKFPAGAFAIFSVSAKASLPIPLSLSPFPSSSFPFPSPSDLSFALKSLFFENKNKKDRDVSIPGNLRQADKLTSNYWLDVKTDKKRPVYGQTFRLAVLTFLHTLTWSPISYILSSFYHLISYLL